MIIDYWPYFVSAFSGILLGAIIVALIASKSFRQDLAASDNKASLFNVISIEGAVVLVMCGIFFYGMIYPVLNPHKGFSLIAEASNVKVETPKELIDLYKSEVEKSSSLQAEKDESENNIKILTSKLDNCISKNDVATYVRSLSPSDTQSKLLFPYPSKKLGPWSNFQKSEELTVTVPGNIKPKTANVCQELHGGYYRLIASAKSNDDDIFGEAVTVYANGYIFQSSDCQKMVSYDMQISCEDANSIFTSNVITCEKDGAARWPKDGSQRLSVNSVPLPPNNENPDGLASLTTDF